jgi:hypothetical protein
MPLCLVAGGITAKLAVAAFTLAWTHSVERVRWEEDWRVAGTLLVPVEARIKGSGAGMEPPAGAVLEAGHWRYRPTVEPLERMDLARSGAVDDWQFCTARDGCRALSVLLPRLGAEAPVTLIGCR